jgi:hypothetical protein
VSLGREEAGGTMPTASRYPRQILPPPGGRRYEQGRSCFDRSAVGCVPLRGLEMVVWQPDTAPAGQYGVQIGFSKRCDPNVVSTGWTVTVRVDGGEEQFDGQISYQESTQVVTFTR